MGYKDKRFNEDEFLLDYYKFQRGELSSYDYAHKYNMSVPEWLDKINSYKLNPSNVR